MCLLYAQRGDQWEFCIEYQDQVIILLFHFVGRVSNDELRMGFSSNTKKMNFLLSGLWKHFIKYHWGVMDKSICWKPAPLCQDICHGERHPILFKSSVTLRWRSREKILSLLLSIRFLCILVIKSHFFPTEKNCG